MYKTQVPKPEQKRWSFNFDDLAVTSVDSTLHDFEHDTGMAQEYILQWGTLTVTSRRTNNAQKAFTQWKSAVKSWHLSASVVYFLTANPKPWLATEAYLS